MRYSVYGINYESACDLIDELNASGMESNITQGGIAIVTMGALEVDIMNKICKKYHTEAKLGVTPFEEDIMIKKDRIKVKNEKEN